jgi:hypothetical protein
VADGESKETLLATCEHCEATVAGIVEGSYQRYIDEPGYSLRWSLLSCPSCQSPILVSQDDEDARYMDGKRAFYRTGCARGWPRRRVTPGPSGIIGTA